MPRCRTVRYRHPVKSREPQSRQMGTDGWLGVGWPKEYGGRGFGPMEQFVFYDEAQRAGAPRAVPVDQHGWSGDHAVRFRGAEKRAAASRIMKPATCFFSIGYSEPGSGTDLASV